MIAHLRGLEVPIFQAKTAPWKVHDLHGESIASYTHSTEVKCTSLDYPGTSMPDQKQITMGVSPGFQGFHLKK